MEQESLTTRNAVLADICRQVFGDSMQLRMVEPKSLILLKKNARYFKKDTFQQLRDNVRDDKMLSSVPLCYQHEDGSLEVLSGNHRVQASVEAGLENIFVLVILETMEASRRIAIQLSHNSLVGEDDKNLLAELWASIDAMNDKLYAGLSSDIVEGLEKIELVPFTTPQVYSRTITLSFTETEASRFNGVLESLESLPTKEIYVADLKDFERFFNLLEDVKKSFDIKNVSLAMLQLVELAEESLSRHKIATGEADEANELGILS